MYIIVIWKRLPGGGTNDVSVVTLLGFSRKMVGQMVLDCGVAGYDSGYRYCHMNKNMGVICRIYFNYAPILNGLCQNIKIISYSEKI